MRASVRRRGSIINRGMDIAARFDLRTNSFSIEKEHLPHSYSFIHFVFVHFRNPDGE